MTGDKLSKVDRGRMAYDLAHNPEFRRQLKATRYAQQAEAAMQEQAAEREAAKQEREAQRANRPGGSVASGRARYDELHPKKKETPAEDDADHDPLGTAGDGRERINDTERSGYRGIQAGRARLDRNHDERGAYRKGSAGNDFEE